MSEQSRAQPAAGAAELAAYRHRDAPAPGTVISSHFHRCYGCGPDHPTGLHLQLVAEEGLAAHGTLVVTADHQGAPGLAHGGVLAAAVDEVFGSLGHLLRRPMVTAKLEVHYRRPVPVGTTVHIRGQVDRIDGRKVYVSAVAREQRAPQGDELATGDAGAVVVRGTALFVLVDMEHFRAHGRPEDLAAAAADPHARAALESYEVNP